MKAPKRDAGDLIEHLSEDPTNIPLAILMDTYTHTWRAHFHHRRYRMVYEISPGPKTVLVLRMGPRPNIYDGMKKPQNPKRR
jgi:mRNA-degrading endonuclease RelE of RelBE toxin-antitoxin system